MPFFVPSYLRAVFRGRGLLRDLEAGGLGGSGSGLRFALGGHGKVERRDGGCGSKYGGVDVNGLVGVGVVQGVRLSS